MVVPLVDRSRGRSPSEHRSADDRCALKRARSWMVASPVPPWMATVRTLRVGGVSWIERQTIHAVSDAIALLLLDLLDAVVTVKAERLQFAEPHAVPIAVDRFDVVGDA